MMGFYFKYGIKYMSILIFTGLIFTLHFTQ